MKILYFNVSELNKGWGAECFVDRGLKSLGHEVINIDYRKHRLNLVDKILSLKDWDIEAVIFQRADHFPIEII